MKSEEDCWFPSWAKLNLVGIGFLLLYILDSAMTMDLVAADFNREELEEGLVVSWEYLGVEVIEVKAISSENFVDVVGFEAEYKLKREADSFLFTLWVGFDFLGNDLCISDNAMTMDLVVLDFNIEEPCLAIESGVSGS